MSENIIITVGRQFGSGGHEIGRRLSQELGLKLYDKELLKLVAEESGICEKVLENFDEQPTSSLLYSLVMDVYPSMNYVGTTLNQQVFQAQFDSIRRLGETGNCVLVGRAADYILRDKENLTSVFIHADLNWRTKRVAEFEHISMDKARDLVVKADKKRANFYNFQTENRWGQAASYDLCVDSSDLGIDNAVKLIETYIRMKHKSA